MTREEQQAYFDPDKVKTTVGFYTWRQLGENLKSVARAPLPFGERVGIFYRLIRRAISDRDTFGRELVTAARALRAGSSS